MLHHRFLLCVDGGKGKTRKRNCGNGIAEKRVKGGKTEKRVKGGKVEKRVKAGKKAKHEKKGKTRKKGKYVISNFTISTTTTVF